MKLQTQIFLALVAGVALAAGARAVGFDRVTHTFLAGEFLGTAFVRLVTMVVIPLVVASVCLSVTSLGDARRLGRLGGLVLAYMVATTFAAAVIGVTIALVARLGQGQSLLADPGAGSGPVTVVTWRQMLVNLIPANPIAAAGDGDLLPLMVSVVLFALAAATVARERTRPMLALLQTINDVSTVMIGWVMRLAPAAVFVLMGATVARFGLDALRQLLGFALVVILALAVHLIVVLVPLIALSARMSVARFFAGTSEALLLAFSTASSSAALPVSIENATRLGFPADIVGFVLPAGATLNKNGAAAYKAVTAVFLAGLYGLALGPWTVVTIVLASTLAGFAGAGVPGSSLVTTLIVLNAVGLGPHAAAGIALVAGIDRPLDMCRTAVNTAGNLVGAAVVARRQTHADHR